MTGRYKSRFALLRQMISMLQVCALVFSSVRAQTPAQQPQEDKNKQGLYSIRVESELVLVNVVARDKQGKLVSDLKRDEFTLLEDGKPQRISSFDFENLDMQPLTAAAGPSQQSKSGPAPTPTPAKPILTAKDADQ